MSVPLGKSSGQGGPRPTEQQLAMARVRARVTGESLSHVLSVFMGAGRHGAESGAASTGPEAPLADGGAGPSGTDRDEEDSAQLAPVIPLSRAARGDDASGDRSED
ncbi:hypothetical protein G4Z16_20770 [Streptomyces bathyalis]|uniref:Uncharacterized protein n=1 Tax=Streptomyces bathyalis TaxID=2710756 RepID=A0A7T1WTR7_9ACTN|nr:hypothetical protein [Streptomyces bathyalis]QPP08427.1 hypothetical protein G4Z16_20770 [Streptomyces bathyalis]